MKFGYKFLYYTIRLVFYAYFKRVFYTVAKGIPKDKPVLLACNHPNSFLDGFIVAALQRQPIYFIARGDAMNTPLKKWFFGLFHAIPIFRIQEGIENLHLNKKTFEECERLLKENAKIIIFSEGICVHEKRVRKLKKGTARLFFQIEENLDFGLDIQVIPVGINYTYFQKPDAEVMINVEQPLDMSQYISQYKENKPRAINALTNDLEIKLKEQVIVIDKKEDESIVEQLLPIIRNEGKEPELTWKVRKKDRFLQEKYVCDVINDLSENHNEDLISFRKKVNDYYTTLNYYRLQDRAFSHNGGLSYGKWIFLFLGWPVFIVGFLLNVLPVWVGRKLARKIVTNSVFYTSVLAVSEYLTYIMIQIPILITIGLSFGVWMGVAALGIALVGGYFALYYYRIWNNGISRLRFLWMQKKDPALINNLKAQREVILEKIRNYKVQPYPSVNDLAENF